ncbi:MAG: DUF1772 domain-containing protein [Nitrospirota bacterium]
MIVKLFRFISLFTMGLEAGLSLSHALQWPIKASFPAEMYLWSQYLYTYYGLAGGIIESSAMISTTAVLFLVRKRRSACVLTLIGLVCIVVMFLVWLLLINPINLHMITWREMLPSNWIQLRDRWHFFHAVRLALASIGMSALILSVLLEHDRQQV